MATNRDACPAQLGSAFSQDCPVGVCEPNGVCSSPGPEFRSSPPANSPKVWLPRTVESTTAKAGTLRPLTKPDGRHPPTPSPGTQFHGTHLW